MKYNSSYNAKKHAEKYIILDWAGNVKTFNKKSSIKLFDDLLDADDYLDEQVYKMSKSKDEKEIIKSLHSGDELGGYGTDVVRDEFGNIKNSKLIEFANSRYPKIMGSDRIVITPHVGGMTWEGQTKAYKWAVDKFGEINGQY